MTAAEETDSPQAQTGWAVCTGAGKTVDVLGFHLQLTACCCKRFKSLANSAVPAGLPTTQLKDAKVGHVYSSF